MRLNDLKGKVFGRLTVLSRSNEKGRRVKWLCVCVCGSLSEIVSEHLTSGKTQSCGCLKKESIGNVNLSHGMCTTREYKSWSHAKSRCFSKSNPKYKLYGERGITMCDAWKNSFSEFILHMGAAPRGYTLDRIDVNGNYEPGNCRWATAKQQANNTRRNVMSEAFGFVGSLKQIAEHFGIPYKQFHHRVHKCGYTPEQAVTSAKIS